MKSVASVVASRRAQRRVTRSVLLAAASLCLISAADVRAADLPAYPVSAPPIPMTYNWSGIYLGANIGYGWGEANYNSVLTGIGPLSSSESMDGAIGGVQTGYNYQFGAWVAGFETDIQFSGVRGGSTFQGGGPAMATITTDKELEWFGTSRLRFGYLMTPTILLYGTGGVAYGQVKETVAVTAIGIGSHTDRFEDVKAGWTAGGGIEGAFAGGWSAKLEYLYVDLGTTTHTHGSLLVGTVGTDHRDVTFNIVRAGLNYRWGR